MRAFLAVVLLSAALTSCGGGGISGSDHDACGAMYDAAAKSTTGADPMTGEVPAMADAAAEVETIAKGVDSVAVFNASQDLSDDMYAADEAGGGDLGKAAAAQRAVARAVDRLAKVCGDTEPK